MNMSNMNYAETQVRSAFLKLNYTPRENQIEVATKVVNHFLSGKRNVIMNAPTGFGKSITAAVIAQALNERAVYLSSTNNLVDQYADTFAHFEPLKFYRAKGAANFTCGIIAEQQPFDNDASHCSSFHDPTSAHCQDCEYNKQKTYVWNTENLITNYAYRIAGDVASKERGLQVCDEAHLLNETFCSLVTLDLNVKTINKLINEIERVDNGKCEQERQALTKLFEVFTSGKLSTSYLDVPEFLGIVKTLVNSVIKTLNVLHAGIPDMQDKIQILKRIGKCENIVSLIGRWTQDNTPEHVVDVDENGLVIRPIFIGDEFSRYSLGKNLFMSGTISPSFVETTLRLNHAESAYVYVPDVYPSENKKLLFLGNEFLNYQKMQDRKTLQNMFAKIGMILELHSADKGIILVPSFKLAKEIVDSGKINQTVHKVFLHESGIKSKAIIDEFKVYQGPSILISPSIFEGVDLEGDVSRFQIICKTPYASLGDSRVKYIANNYKEIYSEQTLYKILQGIGRSIRSKDDYAVTYFLDLASQKLFFSSQNLWLNNYKIIKKH